eukprot:gnl/MRDRNA2_/MRDRNA2_66138_c0_seq1.p1 gnl/MRDRNA2_/MRDRNA2_66138_c0~~gnl/MRDRNA2_/MRDRNA2_66138_c0_seq1.p1  ORF type:complete len:349 (-),score=53.91 gnl/MRDRNA2_/MRDRNA2_66138_c0_seq1:35-1081(-)
MLFTWPKAFGCAAVAVLGAGEAPVRRLLVDELFLGNDPLLPVPGNLSSMMDKGMTHMQDPDVDAVLKLAPSPLHLWVELGSWEGGSAIRTANRIKLQSSGLPENKTTVLCVDTFLGDLRTIWTAPREDRSLLLKPDGTTRLLERFRHNIHSAGHADVVIPLPATSVVALRVLEVLSRNGTIPSPQVIYLDSAHEEGEVLLEMELAWAALAPGGILFGDDWQLYGGVVGDTEPVQRDVLRFAEVRQAELDDNFGPDAFPTRTLGRVRPGLFVSYLSFQWFIKKSLDAGVLFEQESRRTMVGPSGTAANFDCWSGGFGKEDCCNVARYGEEGNPKCWDIMFTFSRCCNVA